jgi:hypothetical protein
MTTIRTTCKHCGDVELTTRDIGLELAAEGSTGHYRFDCPYCDSTQRRPANHRVVSILLATGVEYQIISEFGPITEDEISGFANALDNSDWFSELAAN